MQPASDARDNTKSKLLPFKVACETASCSAPTMYHLIRTGRVKAYKIGHRTLIDERSLHEGMRAEPLVLGEPKQSPATIALAKKRAAAKADVVSKHKAGAKAKPARRPRRDDGERRAAT